MGKSSWFHSSSDFISIHKTRVTSKPAEKKCQELHFQMFMYPLSFRQQKKSDLNISASDQCGDCFREEIKVPRMVKLSTSKSSDVYVMQGKQTVLWTHMCPQLSGSNIFNRTCETAIWTGNCSSKLLQVSVLDWLKMSNTSEFTAFSHIMLIIFAYSMALQSI